MNKLTQDITIGPLLIAEGESMDVLQESINGLVLTLDEQEKILTECRQNLKNARLPMIEKQAG